MSCASLDASDGSRGLRGGTGGGVVSCGATATAAAPAGAAPSRRGVRACVGRMLGVAVRKGGDAARAARAPEPLEGHFARNVVHMLHAQQRLLPVGAVGAHVARTHALQRARLAPLLQQRAEAGALFGGGHFASPCARCACACVRAYRSRCRDYQVFTLQSGGARRRPLSSVVRAGVHRQQKRHTRGLPRSEAHACVSCSARCASALADGGGSWSARRGGRGGGG